MHELRRRLGAFSPAPRFTIEGSNAMADPVFRLALGAYCTGSVDDADRIARGEYQAYFDQWRPLPRTAGEWHGHPHTGLAELKTESWWKVHHLGDDGDVKDIWEPARFAWLYPLMRAFLATGNLRYVSAAEEHYRSWSSSSPPFRGIHWSCGQEVAVRAIALLHAEATLPISDTVRWEVLKTLGHSGERIADAIGYAVSQRNNHALGEAVGLMAIGWRLRGLHPHSLSWLTQGRAILEREALGQFAPDGWYSQHSFTYMRVALEYLMLAQRLLQLAGDALGPLLQERIAASARLLSLVMNSSSGVVPNHGPNDGAWVMPVVRAAYRDFRPLLTALNATFRLPHPIDIPLNRDILECFDLPEPPEAPARPLPRVVGGGSGWVAAAVGGVEVFMRAATYAGRPHDWDPLHVDVRIDSTEIIVDAGTFSYNAEPPFRNGLSVAKVHNGPVMSNEQPRRLTRFLWADWPEAHIVRHDAAENKVIIAAERSGRFRRELTLTHDGVRIVDTVLHQAAGEMVVRFLLHPAADPELLRIEAPYRCSEGSDDSVLGWFSESYGTRARTRYVESTCPASRNSQIVTTVAARQRSLIAGRELVHAHKS